MPKGPLEAWLRLLESWVSRTFCSASRSRSQPHNLFLAVIGYRTGHDYRRPARSRRRQWRGDSAAADLLHAADLGHHPADVASTGARSSAAPSRPSCSTSPASPGRWPRRSTAIPMARQGRGGQALTAAFTFVVRRRAIFAVVLHHASLRRCSPRSRSSSGPPEFFAIQLLTFSSSFIGLGGGNPLKSLVSILIGFILAAVGLDIVTGQLRLTFGITGSDEGLRFHRRRHRLVRHR